MPSQVTTTIIAILPFLFSAEAAAQLFGRPRVVDGDGLVIGGISVRLHGIDAPERDQVCTGQRGVAIACGQMARNALAGLIGDREVRCEPETRDRYGRTVAVCFAVDLDLGREMVRLGWARAYTQYSDRYLAEQRDARAARRSLWRWDWALPSEWRRSRRN